MKQLFIRFCFLFLCVATSAFAEDGKTVLILNSDSSINAYLTAQSFFKSKFTGTTIEMDLGNRWIEEEEVRKLIHDERPEVIYAIGARAYLIANRVAKKQKIVFSSLLNWNRFSMDENVRGIANELPAASQMMTYRYLFPRIKKIGILYSGKTNEEWVEDAMKMAKDYGLEIFAEQIETPERIEEVTKMLIGKVEALWLIPDPVVVSSKKSIATIFSVADAAQKPVFAYREFFSQYGATLIVSIDTSTIGKQAALQIENLIAGKDASSKVLNPAGSYLTMSLKQVKEYRLELNRDALSSVNEVLQ